ncbi:MAG TPA: SDR family oxidoreductase [Acidimicrobiales bacterium]|nr:SDR family oxidoreductase [Acidimicrobiales bacterium]
MSRVVVVTGGGNGIGAAVAAELHRQGWYVVTVDPMVSLDGSQKVEPATPAVGDRAVDLSVTDADGVHALFAALVNEFGALDAVVNVAGISRPTSFTAGSEEDWRAVLSVHLDGYRNVLAAALPLMEAAGHGRILGVTSGSGWRFGDAGAYGCAKRAVAALTWQLGACAPDGVVVNAMSPIAVTRMVTAALERAGAAGAKGANAGPLFGTMPQPEEIGPLGAFLVSDDFTWCTGEIVFAGGSEAAVVEAPRLLEVIPSAALADAGAALLAAEASQSSGGGSNPRTFGPVAVDAPAIATCALVSDRPAVADAIAAALKERGVDCTPIASREELGDADALVVALAGSPPSASPTWDGVLAEHDDLVEALFTDAMWARAVADADRPMRLVTVTDAATAGGFSRAQAAAQHARPARKTTKDRVAAFAVSDEGASADEVGAFVSWLASAPETVELSGAELVAGPGWYGIRSHPRAGTSIVLGGAVVPPWLNDALKDVIR